MDKTLAAIQTDFISTLERLPADALLQKP